MAEKVKENSALTNNDMRATNADVVAGGSGSIMATIMVCIPESGIAIIAPEFTSDAGLTSAVAYLPYVSAADAVAIYAMYTAGTAVTCVPLYNASSKVYAITGVCNRIPDGLVSNYSARKLFNVEPYSQSHKTGESAANVIEHLAIPTQTEQSRLVNHAHNVDGDAIAGDYDVQDKSDGAGLHVGKYIISMHGSPLAFVAISTVNNEVMTVASSVHTDTPLQMHAMEDTYQIDCLAINMNEAFGLSEPGVVEHDGERLKLKHPEAVPLYRVQTLSGDVAAGVQSMTVCFPKDSEVHDQNNPPAVMSCSRQTLSGLTQLSGTLSNLLVKTPFIPAVEPLGYGAKKPLIPDVVGDKDGISAVTNRLDDNLTPYEPADTPDAKLEEETKKREKATEERRVVDAALNKLIDTILSGDYREAMLKLLAEKGFSVAGKEASILSRFKDVKVIGGAETAQFYPIPPAKEETDPVTGEVHSYYPTMSFISQEPDGSICICDGYGSEIRMCRGNIYISPALDLVLRPGRDLSVMAGRHQSYNSQDTCTINTSKSMYIRANEDLRMAGATKGTGSVVLESDGAMGSGGIGGLTIRSASAMSVTAVNDMYIGRNPNNGMEEGAVTDPPGGILVIDAGRTGVCRMGGGVVTVDSQQTVIGGYSQSGQADRGSAIIITQSAIAAVTPYLIVPAVVAVRSLDDQPTVPVMRNNAMHMAPLLASSTAQLTVEGNVLIDKNLNVAGFARICGKGRGIALYAKGIASTPGTSRTIDAINPRPRVANDPTTAPFYVADPEPVSLPSTFGQAGSKIMENAYKTVYQNKYIFINGFRFPESYNVTLDVMPGMVWQDRSLTSDKPGGYWHEEYITTVDSKVYACYPGKDIWESAYVSSIGYKADRKLQGGYVINRKTEKTNG